MCNIHMYIVLKCIYIYFYVLGVPICRCTSICALPLVLPGAHAGGLQLSGQVFTTGPVQAVQLPDTGRPQAGGHRQYT